MIFLQLLLLNRLDVCIIRVQCSALRNLESNPVDGGDFSIPYAGQVIFYGPDIFMFVLQRTLSSLKSQKTHQPHGLF